MASKIPSEAADITVEVKTEFSLIRGSPYSAGYDICANEDGIINPGDRKLISTGVYMAIPNGYYAHISPRSGLAYKYGIDVLAGICDSDYRGDYKAILLNTGKEIYEFHRGDKIAQVIFKKFETVKFIRVEELSTTERNTGGFGSTDSKN